MTLLANVIMPLRAQGSAGGGAGARDAAAAVRLALERGAAAAIDALGRPDGYWGNERVRIALPDWITRGESALKLLGRGRDIEALKRAVNRAAEQAVPQGRALVLEAVKTLTVTDALDIVRGGNDAVTRYFAQRTRPRLTDKLLPIVRGVTDSNGLARDYNALAQQGELIGVLKPGQARIEEHVTARALDGLYLMIAAEENKLRSDPLGSGSELLRKVFGGR